MKFRTPFLFKEFTYRGTLCAYHGQYSYFRDRGSSYFWMEYVGYHYSWVGVK